ncbi:MAG: hypothetical protein QXR05_11925, partial [Candidatus Methanomethylicia archaeon]
LASELLKKLEEYDSVFKNASERHNVGVFLTLTMNPEVYPNLYEASVRIYKALNRLMSFLTRRLGFRPDYIAVFEPQDSGNPHLHVIIFGVERIEDHYKLTKILVKHGFGYIHFEYKIRKVHGKWVWANRANKPENCKTIDVKDYLKKYLTKVFNTQFNGFTNWKQEISVSEVKLAYYFASNKRFFTCSRLLMIEREAKVSYGWFFIGSWYWLDVPNWVLELANVTLASSDKYVWKAEALDG